MKILIPIGILLMLSACSCNSEKDRYLSLVEEWQGKQIVLPDYMTDFLTGDTIDLIDSDFTIISYADSVGCTGCKMKLPLWKEFLSSIDSVSDSDVRFLMIVHPHGTKDLDYFLKQDEFSYAVYLDSENKISVANSFPEETAFQTFLIDRNRKVTAVGNPVYSSPIAELYKEIISGQMSVSAESRNVVSVSDNRINLGSLNSGEAVSREIVFSNHGNDTVRIQKVIPSCDCTVLSLPEEYITPKSELKAILQFTGDTVPGDFERIVHVYYSDFVYPTVITVSGNIIH